MDETADNSIKENSIPLSRNTPVALVVGAAGFIGSIVSEELIKKNIQVIGVDNFSTGKFKNLENLNKEKNFHLINTSAENLNLNVDRLDYIFIVTTAGWDVSNAIKISKKFNAKTVFISEIALYDSSIAENLKWFKETEAKIAKATDEQKLNFRIIRLSSVFGPRMRFNNDDPIVKLIQASIKNNIQKETSLDFSTRALYITDAVNLICKSIFSGVTALKIYDGVGEPIKVSDIRQILIDPSWHENNGFIPEQLPPWPTPNLEKTKKELSWKPRENLIKALKTTLKYFENNEMEEEKTLEVNLINHLGQKSWDEEKKRRLEISDEKKLTYIKQPKKSKFSMDPIYKLIGILIITYGLIYPIFLLGYGGFTFKQNLTLAVRHLEKNQFSQSNESLKKARDGLNQVNIFLNLVIYLSKIDEFENLEKASQSILEASEQAVKASEDLYLGLLSISGEKETKENNFYNAQINLAAADNNFSKAKIIFGELDTKVPFLETQLTDFEKQIDFYSQLTKDLRNLTEIFPLIIEGNRKKHLVILVNNYNLNLGGGTIEAASFITFEKGKVKKIDSLKSLNFANLTLEPDFPSNARKILSSNSLNDYHGVIAIDFTTTKKLLELLGPIKLEKIQVTENNFDDLILQNKLTANDYSVLVNDLMNKFFFIPDKNWIKIVDDLRILGEGKHLLIFTKDLILQSFLIDKNLSGNLTSQNSKDNNPRDFLAVFETNLNKNANLFINRSDKLETTINKNLVEHTLRINLSNSSRNLKFQEKINLYLPLGAKIKTAKWAEVNLPSITPFSDFNLAVYQFEISLEPLNQKTLMLNYEIPLNFEKDYKLKIFKQLGSNEYPFEWTVNNKLDTKKLQINSDKVLEISL